MPATDDDTLLPFALPSIDKKKIAAAFEGGTINSDGGVFLLAGAISPAKARGSRLLTPAARNLMAAIVEGRDRKAPGPPHCGGSSP